VNGSKAAPRVSTRPLVWAGVLAVALPILTLTTHLTSGTELARVRNALIFDAHKPQNFDWTPATRPGDFLVDETQVDPYFAAVAERLHLPALPSDWGRAKAIVSHLLGSHPPLVGGAVQSNLTGTYKAIIGEGRGYCADFVLVFRALTSAAGVPVRAWAFSFDGFGGYGHVWPEIWDRKARRWYLLDVYNNNYFVRAGTDIPLSALEFREILTAEPDELRLLRIDPRQPPGYADERKMLAYYRRGLPEWFLVWGNNPFTYEDGSPYRWLLSVSRPLAQLAAIASGVHPRIRPLLTADNRDQVRSMEILRVHLLLATLSFSLGVISLLWVSVRVARRGHFVKVPASPLHGC
jgi:Transglutaminase-like superfamily